MRLFLSHKSALAYWRLHPSAAAGDASRRKTTMPTTPLDTKLLDTPDIDLGTKGLSHPLDVLLASPGARRRDARLRQHVHSNDTPAGSFVLINDKLAVSSPEFCFLQLAHKLPLVQLLQLGYELCGSYALPANNDLEALASLDSNDQLSLGFDQRLPLTSVKRLQEFLANSPGVKGQTQSGYALRYIADKAASPMEAKLSILLVLPYRLGGYGFELPELNARIVPAKSAKRSASKRYYDCDLFWSDYDLAMEYDSDQFHTGPSRIASDSRRRNTLNYLGIVTVTVTNQQIHSIAQFEKVARQLAGIMDRRLQFKQPQFFKAQQKLRAQLW